MLSRILTLTFILMYSISSAKYLVDPQAGSVYQTLRKQGKKLYEKADYKNALLMYKRYYKKFPDQQTAYILADCYWQMGWYDSAMVYLQQSDQSNSIVNEREAEILARHQKYSDALKIYQSLLNNADQSRKELYKLRRSGYENTGQIMNDSMDWKLEYLALNTSAHETAPSIYQNSLVVVSNKKGGFAYPSGKTDYPDKFHFLHKAGVIKDLATKTAAAQQQLYFDYKRSFIGDLTLRTSNDNKVLLPGIEKKKLPFNGTEIELFNILGAIGRVSFSTDGKAVYYSRIRKVSSGNLQLQVCKSVLRGNVWSNGEVLPCNTNSSSSFHPFISKDGKSLYFVSDRAGGKGGFDIYKSVLGEDGKWSVGENVSAVNTIKDEVYPSVYDDQLFIASDGWPGLGGMDIFAAPTKTAGTPKNIGYPVNSSSDDYAIIYVDSSNGYFATNRFGSDDVMHFDHAEKYVQIKSFVINAASGLRQKGASVFLEQKQTDGSWKVIADTITDHTGVYTFNVRPNSSEYRVRTSADGFDDVVKLIDTHGMTTWKEESMTVLVSKVEQPAPIVEKIMEKKNPTVEDIFGVGLPLHHDFDKVEIIATEQELIAQVIEKLQSDASIKLAIISAADCFGDQAYNMKLSRKRAKYVYSLFPTFLRKRITLKWVGNMDPKQPCNDIETNIQDQQVNRYTLLRVI